MLNNKKVEYILEKITHSLIGVTGIDAIVLGGSRATETSGKDSDIDIGIYYDSSTFRKKSIQKGDVLYAAGSLFRCWISLLQVLYAINELYMLNEKGCLQRLQQQKDAYIPKGFAQDAEAALSNLTQESIASSFDKVQEQYDLLNHYIQSNTLSQHTQSLV